jgi:hypothetical protein
LKISVLILQNLRFFLKYPSIIGNFQNYCSYQDWQMREIPN